MGMRPARLAYVVPQHYPDPGVLRQGCFQGETSETIVSLSQGHVSVMLFRADHAEKERGEGGEKGKEGGERKRERRERRERDNCLILFGQESAER